MAKKIDLQPIQEEHIRSLCSFLNFMGVNPKIDSDKDFVQEDIRQPFFGNVKGVNIRARYIKLEGMKIDGIGYTIFQVTEDTQGGMAMTDQWKAGYKFWVERDTGREKKNVENLEARMQIKKKGLFKKEIVDFRWVGGRIADVLNQDTSLKEPLLAHLITAQTTKNEAGIWIVPVPLPSDKEVKKWIKAQRKEGVDIDSSEDAIKNMMPMGQGVWITGWGTNGRKNEIIPLLVPSKDAFIACDRIAKHIRDFATAT